MKLVAGAVLLLSAEQAYAHSHMVHFPYSQSASQVLLPASAALSIVGILMLIWGLVTEIRSPAKP
jgi:lysylphosphatidylglycerol synthetase-like protein (DUF2156 family)